MPDTSHMQNDCEESSGHHEFEVTPEEHGMRLDRMLAARFPNLSRNRLKSLIAQGALKKEGETTADPSFRVKSGQTFAIDIPETRAHALEAQSLALEILHEDADLLVLNKPSGLVVHPAAGMPDGTLVNALLAHCGDSLRLVGGADRCGIVHRLDKDTSGVMVTAKTSAAYDNLVRQFAERRVTREYTALAWGTPNPREGRIEGNIGRSTVNRKKMAVLRTGGKPAITHFRTLRSYGAEEISLLSCRLESGRTHQIRVHMAYLGHPLVGDPLYGRRRPAALKRLPEQVSTTLNAFPHQALHARTLGFEHPKTGEWLDFTTDLPSDLKDLIKLLECL